ncbi:MULTISPECIES: MFS transporter [Streptomyces]|uniref:MFS family permease n=2 Tax=Streptomyces TaxID=1883 RepID=A0ABT9L7J2_STRGD|nr:MULTISPECIES: MFS transporter [Streptomyces]MDP9679674.1 MFS family permease [Streptomyces griseoviridis]GGS99529.1 MFS transporter [Streptomyces griseoviridis]GGU23567.1 MFS transporter [Streptomyces daghestanicus]GHI29945.1 MFS transporter [Streptomyces daghestanicus]
MYLTDRSAPPAADRAPGRRRGRRPGVAPVVLVLGTVSLITDVSSEMVTAVLPLYLVTTLGFSPLAFGTLDGVYNGVGALVQLTGGHLADRVRGHKLLAGLGYGLSALAKPLLLVAGSIGALGAVLALERTGKGLRTAPRDAMISLSTPVARQGRAFGVHRAMDTTGAMLGPLAAFLILSVAADGYDAVFGVSACVAVLGVLVLVLFVPGRRQRPAAPPGAVADADGGLAPVRVREALALLRLPRLRSLAGCAALLGLTTVSDAFLYLLLQRRAEVGEEWFTLLPLGTAAVFLLLAVPLGALADRVGRHTVFLAGHGALLTAYGLLLWAPATPLLVPLVLALHGVFYAATDGVLPAALAGVVPEHLRASGLALVGTGQALARFGCSLGFGAAWTLWGDGPALAGSALGLLCCAAVAGSVLRPAHGDDGRR